MVVVIVGYVTASSKKVKKDTPQLRPTTLAITNSPRANVHANWEWVDRGK